jgi:hypothetical protein
MTAWRHSRAWRLPQRRLALAAKKDPSEQSGRQGHTGVLFE